jgi:hypothetical protein
VGTASVSGNGSYHPSAGFTPVSAGRYWWYATYGGDPYNHPTASACGAAMASTVVRFSSATASVVDDGATHKRWSGVETAGASAYDTATVAAHGVKPTGTVTYSFFKNRGCTGHPASTQKVTLRAGAVPNSKATGKLAAGAYSFRATYSGDTTHLPSLGACEAFAVKPRPRG